MSEPTRGRTTRAVLVPDELGALGLSMAANILENEADRMLAFPHYMQSIQMVADWLRQTAVAVPEAA